MSGQKGGLKQAGLLLSLLFSLHFLGRQSAYSALAPSAVDPSVSSALSEHLIYAIGQNLQHISEESLFQQDQQSPHQIIQLFDSILDKANSCYFRSEHAWFSFLSELQQQETDEFIPVLQELKEKMTEYFSWLPDQGENQSLSLSQTNRAIAFQQALRELQKGIKSLLSLTQKLILENPIYLSLFIPTLLRYKSDVYTWKKRLNLLKEEGFNKNKSDTANNDLTFLYSLVSFLEILGCEMTILLGKLQRNQKEQDLEEINQTLQPLTDSSFSLSDFFTVQLFSLTPIESEAKTLQIEKDSLLYNVAYLSQNLKKILSYYQIR